MKKVFFLMPKQGKKPLCSLSHLSNLGSNKKIKTGQIIRIHCPLLKPWNHTSIRSALEPLLPFLVFILALVHISQMFSDLFLQYFETPKFKAVAFYAKHIRSPSQTGYCPNNDKSTTYDKNINSLFLVVLVP